MALERTDHINPFLGRTIEPDGGFATPPRVRTGSTPERIYNTSLPELERMGASSPSMTVPKNRKATQRKISPFTIVLFLIGAAIVSVLYISNILTVGRLLAHINKMQAKHQQILNEQEMLKVQLNRLASLDRIQQVAQKDLNLINPKQAPVWIEIDPEKVEQVEEIFHRQTALERTP